MQTLIILLIATFLILFILASLQLKSWHWCPRCFIYWSEEGDESMEYPHSATGTVEQCLCPKCATIAAIRKGDLV